MKADFKDYDDALFFRYYENCYLRAALAESDEEMRKAFLRSADEYRAAMDVLKTDVEFGKPRLAQRIRFWLRDKMLLRNVFWVFVSAAAAIAIGYLGYKIHFEIQKEALRQVLAEKRAARD